MSEIEKTPENTFGYTMADVGTGDGFSATLRVDATNGKAQVVTRTSDGQIRGVWVEPKELIAAARALIAWHNDRKADALREDTPRDPDTGDRPGWADIDAAGRSAIHGGKAIDPVGWICEGCSFLVIRKHDAGNAREQHEREALVDDGQSMCYTFDPAVAEGGRLEALGRPLGVRRQHPVPGDGETETDVQLRRRIERAVLKRDVRKLDTEIRICGEPVVDDVEPDKPKASEPWGIPSE